MKFKVAKGKDRNVNITPYLIDWDHKVSGPQLHCKNFLYKYWKRDVVLEEFRIPTTRLRIDLYNVTKKLVVEVSPAQHFTFNKFFHGDKLGLKDSYRRDWEKEEWVKLNGLAYVEIMDEDMDVLSPKWFKDKYDIDL